MYLFPGNCVSQILFSFGNLASETVLPWEHTRGIFTMSLIKPTLLTLLFFGNCSLKPGAHIPPTYLRRSRRLELSTVGDLSRCLLGASSMDRRRTQISRQMQIELAQFSTIPSAVWIESSYWSASFRFLSFLWRQKKVGEDENSKKVLGAANASRAKTLRPVSCVVRRVATPRPGIFLQVL